MQEEEHDWYLRRERIRARAEGVTSVGGYDLDKGLPRHKPAFRQFIVTHGGGIWVVRPGLGDRRPGCDDDAAVLRAMGEAPCWRDRTILDAFGAEGRYLGEIDIPEIFYNKRFAVQMFNPQPFVQQELVLAVVEDEVGTIMVKRYRLVVRGEEPS